VAIYLVKYIALAADGADGANDGCARLAAGQFLIFKGPIYGRCIQ
jgi:hypothetical protein